MNNIGPPKRKGRGRNAPNSNTDLQQLFSEEQGSQPRRVLKETAVARYVHRKHRLNQVILELYNAGNPRTDRGFIALIRKLRSAGGSK